MVQLSYLDILHALLTIAGIVAVIALTIVLFNLVTTIRSLNRVLSNAEEIVVVAKEGVDNAKDVVIKLNDVSTDVRSMVSSNKGTLAALGSIVNAGASLASLTKTRAEKGRKK